MTTSRFTLIVIGVVLLAQAASVAAAPIPAAAPSVAVCNGKYKGYLKPTAAELAVILKKNDEWVKSQNVLLKYSSVFTDDPRKANLCNADLGGVDLRHADLAGANLAGVHLDRANLAGAFLDGADLAGADLFTANLDHASLDGADLSNADLGGADLINANFNYAYLGKANLNDAHLARALLTEANLINANLTDAYLGAANLSGANLTDAKLTGVDLTFANVADADFDFDPDSPPNVVPGLYTAWNLHLVKFRDQPAGLVKLRGELKNLGLRAQESQLTYAIRRSELFRRIKEADGSSDGPYVHSWSERFINTAFFDWTCQYGMSPGRPLLIVGALAVFLSIVYIFAQVDPGLNGGIWAVWDEHQIKRSEGDSEPQQLTEGFPGARSQISFLLLALYFSALSATRIGWRELNVGTWIARIQPRQYSLQATGWVRVVSGVQSLISVYLVALTILTYFGTPFEY